MVSLIAFSQAGTPGIKSTDTTVIALPKAVAKEVIKDLIKADSLKSEYDYLKKNYELVKSSLQLKDTLIAGKDTIIGYLKSANEGYKRIIALEEQQTLSYRVVAETLTKKLKDEKKKLIKSNLVLTVVAAAGILLLLK